MTPHQRKRLIGAASVAGAALASAAYGGLSVTTNPAASRAIPASTPGAVVFSIRNTGANALQIGSAQNTGMPAVAGCGSMTITP